MGSRTQSRTSLRVMEASTSPVVVDPLFGAVNSRSDEARHNHEDVREEEEVPDLVGGVGEVSKGVEHEGGSDDPVNVTGEEELAAVVAASVPAVVGSHGEVGEGGNEADAAGDEGRVGEEVEDGVVDGLSASVVCQHEGRSVVISLGDVVVPVEHTEVVAGKEEEDAEGNPEDDRAGAVDAEVARVESAIGTRGEVGRDWSAKVVGLEMAVAALLLSAVGLL